MLQLGRGRALEIIVNEPEALGYRWAYRVGDSRAFGWPQRRQPVFFLASREGNPRNVLLADDAEEPEPKRPSRRRSFGFYRTEGVRGLGAAVDAVPAHKKELLRFDDGVPYEGPTLEISPEPKQNFRQLGYLD